MCRLFFLKKIFLEIILGENKNVEKYFKIKKKKFSSQDIQFKQNVFSNLTYEDFQSNDMSSFKHMYHNLWMAVDICVSMLLINK